MHLKKLKNSEPSESQKNTSSNSKATNEQPLLTASINTVQKTVIIVNEN